MSETLITMLLLAAPTQAAEKSPVLTSLVDYLVDERVETVAVFPRAIFVDGKSHRESLGGAMGPQAEYFCSQLASQISKLGGGDFKVVEASRMSEICRRYTLSDIRRKSIRQSIASKADDAEVLLIPIVTNSSNPTKKFDLRCIAIEVDSNDEEVYGIEALAVSLSDAAYMGESWELRRWDASGLKNVGLKKNEASPTAAIFGTGASMEQRQYNWIDRKRPHPLAKGSLFPAKIQILVGGKPVSHSWSADELTVTLNKGDKPVIRVSNTGIQDVYALLFVDGVNVLGKRLEHPASAIPRQRHRLIKNKSNFLFEGWYTPKAKNNWTLEPFVISNERDSEAAKAGSVDHLGRITCLFYTVGWQGVPPGDRFSTMTDGIGFGAGRSRPVKLDVSNADSPGLLTAAVTIRYASDDQSKKLNAP
jgi:hypothetical protein